MPSMQSHLGSSGSVRGVQPGDYMRGYRVLGGGELPKKETEEQAKEQKRHRDVLNFTSEWITGRCWPSSRSSSPTQEQPPANNQTRIDRDAKTAPIGSSRRVSLPPSCCFSQAAPALLSGVP
jgi:hypothetical protein